MNRPLHVPWATGLQLLLVAPAALSASVWVGRFGGEGPPPGASWPSRAIYGNLPARLSGRALASDTDNTGSIARAGFAQFRFVADAGECETPRAGAAHGG